MSEVRINFIIEQLGHSKTGSVNPNFEQIPQSPYSLDFLTCDFFSLLKRDLKGNHYSLDNEMKVASKSWIRKKSEFCNDEKKKLDTCWEKYIVRPIIFKTCTCDNVFISKAVYLNISSDVGVLQKQMVDLETLI